MRSRRELAGQHAGRAGRQGDRRAGRPGRAPARRTCRRAPVASGLRADQLADRAHAGGEAGPGVHDRARPARGARGEDDHRIAVGAVTASRRRPGAAAPAGGAQPGSRRPTVRTGPRAASSGSARCGPAGQRAAQPATACAAASARISAGRASASRARQHVRAGGRVEHRDPQPELVGGQQHRQRRGPGPDGHPEGVSGGQPVPVQRGGVRRRRGRPARRGSPGRRVRQVGPAVSAGRSGWRRSAAPSSASISADPVEAGRCPGRGTRRRCGSTPYAAQPAGRVRHHHRPAVADRGPCCRRTRLRKARSVGEGRRGMPPTARYSSAVIGHVVARVHPVGREVAGRRRWAGRSRPKAAARATSGGNPARPSGPCSSGRARIRPQTRPRARRPARARGGDPAGPGQAVGVGAGEQGGAVRDGVPETGVDRAADALLGLGDHQYGNGARSANAAREVRRGIRRAVVHDQRG